MSAIPTAAPNAPGGPRAWHRFTPRQRLSRFAVYLGLVAAIVASARTVEVIPEFLYDAPQQVQDLLERMWPIAWYHYAGGVHDALGGCVELSAHRLSSLSRVRYRWTSDTARTITKNTSEMDDA